MTGKVAGNLAMTFSKICSGLNQNALRYLQPAWMDAPTGVFLRLGFASIAFWLVGLFTRKLQTRTSWRQKAAMLAIGALCIHGYMLGLLFSLTYSTPVSSSLILGTEPVWVLILSACFLHRPITWAKALGVLLGICGCLLCILNQQTSEIATNPLIGNLCCLGGAILYSVYIVCSKKMLTRIDGITFNKWSFLGGGIASLIGILFVGFYAPVLHSPLFSVPMLTLLFVLVFPSTVSYFLMAVGIKDLPATVVALYGYLILLVAMGMSYILGQDHFQFYQLAAVILIFASVFLVEIFSGKNGGSRNQQPSPKGKR